MRIFHLIFIMIHEYKEKIYTKFGKDSITVKNMNILKKLIEKD